jgi:WhiB family transcriptional regulator, redox-sensing transcriptional regulator
MSRISSQTSPASMDWITQANCQGKDPDLFFPGHGEVAKRQKAIAICAKCVVRQGCLEFAIERRETGIWGWAA